MAREQVGAGGPDSGSNASERGGGGGGGGGEGGVGGGGEGGEEENLNVKELVMMFRDVQWEHSKAQRRAWEGKSLLLQQKTQEEEEEEKEEVSNTN